MKKIIAITLCLFAFPSLLNISASNPNMFTGINYVYANNTVNVGVAYHTQEELIKQYENLGLQYSVTNEFQREPNLQSGSYDSGALSDRTLNDSLNVLNFSRYIAGLSDTVKLDSSFNQYAQDAALIMKLNGSISHSPSKPSGVSESLYKSAYTGASKSNIASGRSDLRSTIINGWLADASGSNLSKVGHRRWILHPNTKKMGVGFVEGYSANYCIDGTTYDSPAVKGGIMWPAQNMPTEFFNKSYPWSYSSFTENMPYDVTVKLTKNNGEQVWDFQGENLDEGGNYLTVASPNYGDSGCIIFRPKDLTYKNGDTFFVEIKSSGKVFASYNVNFFNIEPFDNLTVTEEYNTNSPINYIKNNKIEALEVAGISNKGTLSYQWFAEGEEIVGATKNTFTPPANIGTLDYFCRVTATYEDEEKYTDSKVATVTIAPEIPVLSDISSHWAKSSIEYITNKGFVIADTRTPNNYNPETPITRIDFVTALGTMENVNVNVYKESKFNDVYSSSYGSPYVIWANEKGIVSGMSETSFGSSSSITREQMAVILYNYITTLGYPVEKTVDKIEFDDSSKISNWAAEAVSEIQQMGLLSGKGNNLFDPQGTSTRAEFASLIERFSKLILND